MLSVFVPPQLLDLMPLIGTHYEDFEAFGDVSKQLAVGHRHAKPLQMGHGVVKYVQSMLQPRVLDFLFREGTSGHHEYNAVEGSLLRSCLSHGKVSNRRWVERTGINTASCHGRSGISGSEM
jgi:hypothetical protein